MRNNIGNQTFYITVRKQQPRYRSQGLEHSQEPEVNEKAEIERLGKGPFCEYEPDKERNKYVSINLEFSQWLQRFGQRRQRRR